MPIEVKCSKFPDPLTHLNGTQSMACSKLKILLAALTCGYDGFFQNFKGAWPRRVIHIAGNIIPYIRTINGNTIALDPYYFMTERSENTQGIYYIGQGLTKLFAQNFLSAPIVLHATNCTWQRTTGSAQKVPHIKLNRQEADLFAFDSNDVHVLEAKGRTVRDGSGQLENSILNAVLQKALVQVSSVELVNGKTPKSRCACVWSMCTTGIAGTIQDPSGSGRNAIISEKEILQSNYAIFTDTTDASFIQDILPGFSMTPIIIENEKPIYIGLRNEILEQLRSSKLTIKEALALGKKTADLISTEDRAVTMEDGTVLFAPRSPHFFE